MVEFPSFGEGDDGWPDVGARASVLSCPKGMGCAEFPSADDVGADVGTTASLISLRRVVDLDIMMR